MGTPYNLIIFDIVWGIKLDLIMTSFYVRMFVLRVCRGSQNDLTFSNRITTIFDVCFFYCWSTCSILLVCGFAQCHFWQPHVSTEGHDMNQHREHKLWRNVINQCTNKLSTANSAKFCHSYSNKHINTIQVLWTKRFRPLNKQSTPLLPRDFVQVASDHP